MFFRKFTDRINVKLIFYSDNYYCPKVLYFLFDKKLLLKL